MLFLKQKLQNLYQKYTVCLEKNEKSMVYYFIHGFLITYPKFQKLMIELKTWQSLQIYRALKIVFFMASMFWFL